MPLRSGLGPLILYPETQFFCSEPPTPPGPVEAGRAGLLTAAMTTARAPVRIDIAVGGGGGGGPPPRSRQQRPWRKPAADVAAERAAAARELGAGGVNLLGLSRALDAQELVEQAARRAGADAQPVVDAQAATTALLQAATNARPADEVEAAIAALDACLGGARQLLSAAAADGDEPAEAAPAPAPVLSRPASARGSKGPAPPGGARRRASADARGGVGAVVAARTRQSDVMHRVAPRLWVGGWAALLNECAALRARRVSAVVSVVSSPDKRALPPFITAHYHATVDDREGAAAELAAHFAPVCAFVHAARERGEGVFIHCGAGISRAPSTTAAYLIWALRLRAADAVALVRRARACARPNPGFARALRAWEGLVFAGDPAAGALPAPPSAGSLPPRTPPPASAAASAAPREPGAGNGAEAAAEAAAAVAEPAAATAVRAERTPGADAEAAAGAKVSESGRAGASALQTAEADLPAGDDEN